MAEYSSDKRLEESLRLLGIEENDLMVFGGESMISPQELVPPCINRLLTMRHPETPSPSQNFYLSCYLLKCGFGIEDCKQLFREMFRERYDDRVADEHLKFIKIKEYEPYSCFIVEHLLGLCNPECNWCEDKGLHKEADIDVTASAKSTNNRLIIQTGMNLPSSPVPHP
jgi:DNA primase large subunit